MAALLKPAMKKASADLKIASRIAFAASSGISQYMRSGAKTAKLSKEIQKIQTQGEHRSRLEEFLTKMWRCSENQVGATPGIGFRAKVGQCSLQKSERKSPLFSSFLAG